MLLGLTVSASCLVAATHASFTQQTANSGNTFVAAESFAPPVQPTIDKVSGCSEGYIRQGGSYRVYASSSASSASANVSSISAGQTAAALAAGSYTVGGTTYSYRSASLTADASLAAGTRSFTVTPSTGSLMNGDVTVDNTAPTAIDVQAENKAGGTPGQVEQGDYVTFDFSEPMDPCSVLTGWNGSSAADVVVRITNSGTTNDTLSVWDAGNSTQLALGSVDLNGDPVTSDVTFGASGTASTMVRSGSRITITLGTYNSGGIRTDNKTTPMVWSPSGLAFDRAGNSMSAGSATETGGLDVSF